MFTYFPFNCEFNYFDWSLERNTNEFMLKHDKHLKHSSVTVMLGRVADQLIEHIPEIAFISFVSNFGGLLGMWLGMSCMTAFGLITNLYIKLKLNQFYNINQNNLFT